MEFKQPDVWRRRTRLTEQFEGCKLTAYQDQVGVWTIGYGHTGPEVVADSITLGASRGFAR